MTEHPCNLRAPQRTIAYLANRWTYSPILTATWLVIFCHAPATNNGSRWAICF